jgi:hypothetical protein
VDQNWQQSSPHIASRLIKDNFFVRINSLTSVGIMAARKWSGDIRGRIEKSCRKCFRQG